MDETTKAHEEKQTLVVDVILPEHAARTTTSIFHRTRLELIAREKGLCWLTGQSEEESGHPLEAHHCPIERCIAESGLVDWDLFIAQAKAGDYGPGPQSFDWASFSPDRWWEFVDNMNHNGLLLSKAAHIMRDSGIHNYPWPLWLAMRYVKNGTKFNELVTIHRNHLPPDEPI